LLKDGAIDKVTKVLFVCFSDKKATSLQKVNLENLEYIDLIKVNRNTMEETTTVIDAPLIVNDGEVEFLRRIVEKLIDKY